MNENKMIIYTANDGKTKIDVRLEEETLWLTQAQMCELYQTSKSNVSEHIKHIFEEEELNEESVVRKFRTTAADGKEYLVLHYNLDMIIALGYRVRSIIATRHRQSFARRGYGTRHNGISKVQAAYNQRCGARLSLFNQIYRRFC